MALEEKKLIIALRTDGYGYKEIASLLILPISNVSSFNSRNKKCTMKCPNCKNRLIQGED